MGSERMFRMRAPNGDIAEVPESDVDHYRKKGAVVVASVRTPERANWLANQIDAPAANRSVSEALARGFIAGSAQTGADVIEGVLAGQDRTMNWAALFGALSPPGQTARAMVVTQPKLDFTSLEHGGAASDFIRASARELGLTTENGYRVRLTGQIPLADEEFATVAEGTGIAGVVSVEIGRAHV